MEKYIYVADINPPPHFAPTLIGTQWYNAATDSLFVWDQYEIYIRPGEMVRDLNWQQQGLRLDDYDIQEYRKMAEIMGLR